ncbi:DISARM system helicase DrmA [Streptomyces sp. NBC_00827]|uniref:DISARM system helicase DrmA n=1 Tax=Streptomyces sp. NBC_00827 TaxID=2903677 RepID=UPI003869C43E|nr:DISARM system helicase DrmA [Streptomyces sp. NBC_00827]
MTSGTAGTAADRTSYQIREELESLLERDLHGPWDGPEEELPPGTSPAERYVLGRLVTRDVPSEQPEDAWDPDDPGLVDLEVVETADDDEAPEAPAAVRSGSMAASALGLSFVVPANVAAVMVKAEWGRYERGTSEVHVTEQGRPRKVWRRRPAGGPVEVRLDTDTVLDPVPPDAEQPEVTLRTVVRHRGNRRIVDVSLINSQAAPASMPDTARLYQVRLTVTALDGDSSVFLGHNDPELGDRPSSSDPERLHLALLHREQRDYAHGRQCAVDAEVHPGDVRAWRLRTTCFPAADVRLTVPGDTSGMPGLVLDMARLGSAELARDELVRALRPLATGYRSWLAEQARRIEEDSEIGAYADAARPAFVRAGEIADRLDRAIDLLRDDGVAREAFRFANQAMALQRVRGEVVRARLNAPETPLGRLLREKDVPKNRSWRPFQLAFVLLCLPGLTDPGHRDAYRSVDDGEVQLLFFPTGGGKTEAYLGLTAYTFAIRRLQGVMGRGEEARDGTDGVAVLMRYTLRLLTAQQFQRAAALVCACEWLRQERLAAGDGRWGTTPFRVGLWVGSKVTPNTFEEAKRQVEDAHDRENALGGPLQLVACPWCGSRLTGACLKTDNLRRRVRVFCSDPEGDCLYTERRSGGEGLPVLTVDEEIYRLTPSLVISTVDKLAQLPWKDAVAPLFGLVDTKCTRHGWRTPSFEGFCKSRHPAASGLPAASPEPAMRLRPPDLVIQDELHLISDALGSLVGLYETVVDRLCSRPVGGEPVRPVLVASTATVRRARDQVEQVFARGLTIFPPQLLDAGDTFFSRSVPPGPDTPSRRYRGVCATGERLKSIEIRLVTALLEHGQALFDRYGAAADPYLTVVDYFTSTRELAGMKRLVDDDVADRLASRQVRTRRRRPNVSELTSRMPSSRIAGTLAELERSFDPRSDSSEALEEFRRNPESRSRIVGRVQPLDVLLATSMLQVGVDVPRLGLMVVTGQPKNSAEYIQATSRVGRDPQRPGLVVTLYQWSRPRDLAHYESFGYDHATFGMRVEGLTTTPFSDRALDRGLSGILAAAVRHSAFGSLPNTAAHDVPLSGPTVTALLDALEQRASRVLHDVPQASAVRQAAQYRLDSWAHKRKVLPSGRLGYEEAADVSGLLRGPDEEGWDLWSAPMSLREVEPEIVLQLDRRDRSLESPPAWSYDRPPAGGTS